MGIGLSETLPWVKDFLRAGHDSIGEGRSRSRAESILSTASTIGQIADG
jgi:hypothetical protein